MTRKTTILAGSLALALTLAPGVPAAEAASCSAARSHTVDSTRELRLYEQGLRTYACAYDNGKRHLIGAGVPNFNRNDHIVANLTIADRYVAYTVGSAGPDYIADRVFVRSVRKGSWVAKSVDPVIAEPDFARAEHAEVRSLVLSRRGHAAWLVNYGHRPASMLRTEIVALVSGGKPSLLDSAAFTGEPGPSGIDVDSLALTTPRDPRFPDRLYWLHNGAARTAILGAPSA